MKPEQAPTCRSTEILAATKTLISPALRAAVEDLPAPIRKLADYHFGWTDPTDAQCLEGMGKALRPALVPISVRRGKECRLTKIRTSPRAPMPAQAVTFAVIRTSTHPGHSSSTPRTATARTKSTVPIMHGSDHGRRPKRHSPRMSAIAADRALPSVTSCGPALRSVVRMLVRSIMPICARENGTMSVMVRYGLGCGWKAASFSRVSPAALPGVDAGRCKRRTGRGSGRCGGQPGHDLGDPGGGGVGPFAGCRPI